MEEMDEEAKKGAKKGDDRQKWLEEVKDDPYIGEATRVLVDMEGGDIGEATRVLVDTEGGDKR
jgi:hypothetical protein